MVVPSPLGWEPIPARPRAAWRWALALVAILVAAFITLHEITVSYFALLPGEAQPVNGNDADITVKNIHVGSGQVYLATVLLSSHVTLWDQLFSWEHLQIKIGEDVQLGLARPERFT